MTGTSTHIISLLVVFVAGACVGSFLNVCVTRLPEKESVIFPASHCRSCLAPIAFFDNIPLVSFVLLRGHCRACGARIPLRYLLVEIITAFIAVLLFIWFGFSWLFPAYAVFAAALVVISFVDLEVRIVPDVISVPGAVLGLTLSVVAWLLSVGGFPTPVDSILGVFLGGGMLMAVAWVYERVTGREGMGGGDVKLLDMIGAYLGWSGVPVTLFVGAFLGSMWGIGMMLVKGVDTKYALPFAPFLCAGAFFYLLWGTDLLDRYLNAAGVR